MEQGFDLCDRYVRLDDHGGAQAVDGGESFWSGVDPAAEQGRLVSLFSLPAGTEMGWEIHPDGDELLYLLSGSMDVVIEERDGAHRTIQLSDRRACIVPQGRWHRQVLHTPCELMSVTPGRGTSHREA
jgi:mannose-6-phosphate isomerase-like protein (cupin superfamily)